MTSQHTTAKNEAIDESAAKAAALQHAYENVEDVQAFVSHGEQKIIQIAVAVGWDAASNTPAKRTHV